MQKRNTFFKKFAAMTAVAVALNLALSVPSLAGNFLNAGDNPSIIANATGGQTSLRGLILTIVNYALGFLGLFAVLMVIYGGFTYVSSAGNDDDTGKAKNIIMYALIGIVVILLSFALVNTILGAGTGAEGTAGTP